MFKNWKLRKGRDLISGTYGEFVLNIYIKISKVKLSAQLSLFFAYLRRFILADGLVSLSLYEATKSNSAEKGLGSDMRKMGTASQIV